MRVVHSSVGPDGEQILGLKGPEVEKLIAFDVLRCGGYEWMIGGVKAADTGLATFSLCPTEFPPPLGAVLRRAEDPLSDEEIDSFLGMLAGLHRQLMGVDLRRLNKLFNVVHGTGPDDATAPNPRARDYWPTRREVETAFKSAWELTECLNNAVMPMGVAPVVNPAHFVHYLGEIGGLLKKARDERALASARGKDAGSEPPATTS